MRCGKFIFCFVNLFISNGWISSFCMLIECLVQSWKPQTVSFFFSFIEGGLCCAHHSFEGKMALSQGKGQGQILIWLRFGLYICIHLPEELLWIFTVIHKVRLQWIYLLISYNPLNISPQWMILAYFSTAGPSLALLDRLFYFYFASGLTLISIFLSRILQKYTSAHFP